MASLDDDIQILGHLVAVTMKNVQGCEAVGNSTPNTQVKSLLAKRSIERQHVAEQLKMELGLLLNAGTPGSGGMAAAPPTGRTSAKTEFWSDGPNIVTALEAQEMELKNAYRDALARQPPSSPFRSLLLRSYEVVKMGHDEMLQLRHLLHPADQWR